jgi:hypothetical protein
MDEPIGTETEAETSAEDVESSGPVDTAESSNEGETSKGNPAWESVRTKLDPISFHNIEEDLKGFDKNAESRISSLNQQLKGYSDLGTPEQLQNYSNIAQRLDTEPEVIYNALGEFLKENGRLPQNEKEMKEAVDEEEASNENEDAPSDPRFDQLQQQQQKMQDFLDQQAEEKNQREADSSLEREIGELKKTHPDFTEADVKDVLMRAAFQLQSNGKAGKLSDIAQEYVDNTVNRIRAVPRPGDSAPRLLPTSGGTPGSSQAKPLGKLSRSETQDLIANSIEQSR